MILADINDLDEDSNDSGPDTSSSKAVDDEDLAMSTETE